MCFLAKVLPGHTSLKPARKTGVLIVKFEYISLIILVFPYRNASIKRPGRLLNFLNF